VVVFFSLVFSLNVLLLVLWVIHLLTSGFNDFPPTDNCMYKGWLIPSDFTPSGPDDLKVYVDVRRNMEDDLEPVIVAEWKAKDDGGSLVVAESCVFRLD